MAFETNFYVRKFALDPTFKLEICGYRALSYHLCDARIVGKSFFDSSELLQLRRLFHMYKKRSVFCETF